MSRKLVKKKDPRDMQLGKCTLTAKGILFNGDVSFDEWQGVGEFIERAESGVQWWIGDWLLYGDGRPQWGDKYEQAIGIFNRPYKTLQEYKLVAEAHQLSDRSDNLSWTHHQAVAWEPPSIRKKLLAAAAPDAPDKPPRMTVGDLKKEVKKRKAAEETPPLPGASYRVLYADPPWLYADERTGITGAATDHYDLLDTSCICALHSKGRSIQEISAKNSVLFLWVTSPMLPDGLRVMAAWGFAYKSSFVWNKVRGYFGHYNNVSHEMLLIGLKGDCQPDELKTLHDSVLTIERGQHSKKPSEIYELIESLYTSGPYLELFARSKRAGWHSWGNEA